MRERKRERTTNIISLIIVDYKYDDLSATVSQLKCHNPHYLGLVKINPASAFAAFDNGPSPASLTGTGAMGNAVPPHVHDATVIAS